MGPGSALRSAALVQDDDVTKSSGSSVIPPGRPTFCLMTALSRRDSAQISAKGTSVRSGRRAARGGPPMEDLGRESDHLMLITPERVFYAGLLGRPRKRTPGCCHVYVAVKGNLHLTIDDALATGELFVTLPNSTRCVLARRCRAVCSTPASCARSPALGASRASR